MDISNFDFNLPKSLIASKPLKPRSSAKLLFYEQSSIKDLIFFNLPDILSKNDLLVFNNTKVLPALLYGYVIESKNDNLINKKFEFLLVNQFDNEDWFCLCKPLKKIESGSKIFFSNKLSAQILKKDEKGIILRFEFNGNFYENLNKTGLMPIPPYIRKIRDVDLSDKKDYQPIFSKKWGIKFCFITLHVGIGTFNSIRSKNILDHEMHAEFGEITQKSANIINNTLKAGGRVIPVGTTCLRILESITIKEKKVIPFTGYTNIFITPGYKFKIASGLITNFHLPKSSLFILVSSFVGLENAKKIYSHAIKKKYRFFSYGDGSILFN
jgi:S-adenosylmethionine:tRNA ribosyltransferase-isomerase